MFLGGISDKLDMRAKQAAMRIEAIERSIKTQTEIMMTRLDSMKRSIDIQAVAMLAISKLLAMIASKDFPGDNLEIETDPEAILKKLEEEIAKIKLISTKEREHVE